MNSTVIPDANSPDVNAGPWLGAPAGPPDSEGRLIWTGVLAPATALRELAVAAGAEFYVVRPADIQVTGPRVVPAWRQTGPVELSVVVTPIAPGMARFEAYLGPLARCRRLAVAELSPGP